MKLEFCLKNNVAVMYMLDCQKIGMKKLDQ